MNIKKILTSSILAVMSLSSVTVFNHVNADITANVIADVNGDGKVSSMDILLVKQNIFNIISQNYVKFDINNDGVVNVIDINIVKNLSNDNTTQPQVTNPPVTQPPQTNPPATEPPQTEPPTTEPVVT
ncbi:MAG: dockerin type I domain-containing protein, partial [Oscillospiraceae bacterium]